jgi:hypothetical protein
MVDKIIHSVPHVRAIQSESDSNLLLGSDNLSNPITRPH